VLGENAIDRFLAGLLAIVEWAEDPEDAAVALSRDPDDDYLLALAGFAEVDLLVSGDRDLTEILDPSLPIETPGQFLKRLG
jgi:predicted nucleic acid-binding protein